MTLQDDLHKAAELLLELGFNKEATAVSAAVGKINLAWMAEELLAEEVENSCKLRNRVHELQEALIKSQEPTHTGADANQMFFEFWKK